MKVVHIIKRIETIDEDIKDLRKLEKSISKNKSFSTPIYLSIEKQINILLDSRIKLLGLTIANPPEDLVKEIEGKEAEEKTKKPVKKEKPKSAKSRKTDQEEEDGIRILTQDLIDDKFNKLREEKEREDEKTAIQAEEDDDEMEDDINDASIILLDIALENGTLSKESQEKERKKVRFFKDNFPGGDY
jgi:hypothetical protein